MHHERPRAETVRIFARRAKAKVQPGNEAVPLPTPEQVIRLPRALRLAPPVDLGEVMRFPSEANMIIPSPSILRAIMEARDWREPFPVTPRGHQREPDQLN